MSENMSIVSVVVIFVWNHHWLKVPTNSYSNIQRKLPSFNLYSKAIHFLKEKRPLSFPIPKNKLHLKLIRMRRSNHRDEGRGLLRNNNQGSFVFQQGSLLSHRSDRWKSSQDELIIEIMVINNISSHFHKKSSLCVNRKCLFPTNV